MQVKLQEHGRGRRASANSAPRCASIGNKTFFRPAESPSSPAPPTPRQTFVEFFDYNCPYCRASLPAVKKYYDAHKNDTRFSFIEFPLPQQHGPGAVLAAKASLAARNQHHMNLSICPSRTLTTAIGRIVSAREYKRSDGVIALVSKNSLKSSGQKWELACAKEEKKRLRGIWAYADDRTNLEGVPTFVWSDGNISNFIDSLIGDVCARRSLSGSITTNISIN